MPAWIGASAGLTSAARCTSGLPTLSLPKAWVVPELDSRASAGGQAEAPAKGWPASVCESEGTSGFGPALLATGKCRKSSP